MAINIPTKITVPPDIDMMKPADIREVWQEIQITIQYINNLIDVINDHQDNLNIAVFYED